MCVRTDTHTLTHLPTTIQPFPQGALLQMGPSHSLDPSSHSSRGPPPMAPAPRTSPFSLIYAASALVTLTQSSQVMSNNILLLPHRISPAACALGRSVHTLAPTFPGRQHPPDPLASTVSLRESPPCPSRHSPSQHSCLSQSQGYRAKLSLGLPGT